MLSFLFCACSESSAHLARAGRSQVRHLIPLPLRDAVAQPPKHGGGHRRTRPEHMPDVAELCRRVDATRSRRHLRRHLHVVQQKVLWRIAHLDEVTGDARLSDSDHKPRRQGPVHEIGNAGDGQQTTSPGLHPRVRRQVSWTARETVSSRQPSNQGTELFAPFQRLDKWRARQRLLVVVVKNVFFYLYLHVILDFCKSISLFFTHPCATPSPYLNSPLPISRVRVNNTLIVCVLCISV